ncbi:MAG: rbsC 2 [Verrucomicrobia bacterium]|nr:rbsC 2 [Verrucomicrobiota bacterium]
MRRRELAVAGVLAVLLLVLALRAPSFFQGQPLRSLLTREAPVLVMACGMTVVILTRQIDISVGSQFSVCSVAAGLLAAHGWPIGAVIPFAVFLGFFLGAVNGALVAGLGLPSIVVTLATMVTLRQGLNLVQQGEFVNLPDRVQWFGLEQTPGQWSVLAIALAVLAGSAFALHSFAAGRHFYAVGSDAEAARLAGIRPRRVTFAAFAGMGALCGLAAVMNIVQSPQVQPLAGAGLELKAIAAVVVGGVAISGGRGSVWGGAIGLLLLACIPSALTHLRIEAYWEKAIQGGIILLACATEIARPRAKKSPPAKAAAA